jgi:hypothetical protein
MLELQYSAHTILPDGTPLLSVIETTTTRGMFRDTTSSRATAYVLRAGYWWGERDERVLHRDPRHLRLCEIAMQQQVRASVDGAVDSSDARI